MLQFLMVNVAPAAGLVTLQMMMVGPRGLTGLHALLLVELEPSKEDAPVIR